ncbi:MAG TPA: type II toxin-antitoxin system HicB family antitoxin [Methylomirabilota bacterium]|nr:type II toxin-antitoxin system HicB family antitoxin [Methylomirabilota bacterium]
MTKVLNFRVIVEQDEDGIFVASVPAIPGCHTQGDSYEDAIELCLEEAKVNKRYYQQIDWSGAIDGKSRFLGVTDVPIKFHLLNS